MKGQRVYVGCLSTGAREVFRAPTTPTETTHGERYAAVIGPFRTVRAAIFMRDYGRGNPHCNTVADAERIAKPKPGAIVGRPLPSTVNTRATERKVRGAALRILRRRDLQTDYEHGQWWVTHVPSGAQWSAVDTSNGFDFEQVTRGDE